MITSAVHHVSFSVDDLDAACHFYEGILGLERIARPDLGLPGAWLQTGATQIHLIQKPPGSDTGTPPGKTSPLANHCAFAVEDYEKTRDHLVASGLNVLETNANVGQMWVSDPSGNVIEFITAR